MVWSTVALTVLLCKLTKDLRVFALADSSIHWQGSLELSSCLLHDHPVVKRLNDVVCHTLCVDWLSLHVKHGDCYPLETFYLTVLPMFQTFTSFPFLSYHV